MKPEILLAPTFAESLLPLTTWSIDGDIHCVLLGQDLQSGVAGFGFTLEWAEADFVERFIDAFFAWIAPMCMYGNEDLLEFASVCMDGADEGRASVRK